MQPVLESNRDQAPLVRLSARIAKVFAVLGIDVRPMPADVGVARRAANFAPSLAAIANRALRRVPLTLWQHSTE